MPTYNSGTYDKNMSIRLVLTETSTSLANNNSTISYSLYVVCGATPFSNVKIGATVKIDGKTVLDRDYDSSSTYSCSANSSVLIASGTTTVLHDADGTKTLAGGSCIGSCYDLGDVPAMAVSNTSWTLTALNRKSTVATSAASTDMGTTRTITITRKSTTGSSSFVHTLTYKFGTATGTISARTSSNSVTWTVPKSLASYLTNANSGSGTIYCETFDGIASLGTSSVSFTATIPASTMTKTNATMGKSTSFTVTRATSNLSHKITYSFGATSGTAVSTSSNTSLSWTPPYSLAGQLAITSGTNSGTITYTLTTYNGTATVGTKTYTATLTAPSASLFCPSNFTMGTASTITISEQDAAFSHTIVGEFGGSSQTFSNKTSATSVSANWLTATFAPLIPTAKSGTGTIKHTAYSGNTVVAYNEYTCTVSVPSTAPTATITTAVVTSLSSPFDTVYIQNNSKVKVTVSLSSPTGAYLNSASMTIDGVTKKYSVSSNVTSWSGSVTSNLLQTSGTRTISVTVTDKRGYSGTYTTTISVTAYSNPTISAASGESKVIIERSDPQGTADPAGACLHLKFVRKISAITNNNGYVSYKVGSGTETTISTSTSGSVTINQTLNLSWSEHNTYTVTVRVWDAVGYDVTRTVIIPSLNVTLDLRQGGLGVGVGMFSQGANRFDVAWSSWFNRFLYGAEIASRDEATSGGRTYTRIVPDYDYTDLLSGTADTYPYGNFIQAWLKQVCVDNPQAATFLYFGAARPGTRGMIAALVYNSTSLNNGLPNYSTGIYFPYNADTDPSEIIRFGTTAGTFYINRLLDNTSRSGSITYVSNSIITSASNLGMTLRKSGNVVTLDCQPTFASVDGGTTPVTVATLPSGYLPQSQVVMSVPGQGSSSSNYMCSFYALSGGDIRVYKHNTSTATYRANLSWITG